MYIKGVAILSLFSVFLSCKKKEIAPLPVANFYVENNNCSASCDLIFHNQSTNEIQLFWTFGNGLSSKKDIDTITYETDGDYEVWLYATNSDGITDSIRKQVTINL